MERETTVIETPVGKHKVTLYTYLTGREIEHVQEALFQAMKMKSSSTGEVSVGDIDPSQMLASTHRLLETLVVSVDGGVGGIEPVLDMRSEDYQFVLDAVNTLTKKN